LRPKTRIRFQGHLFAKKIQRRGTQAHPCLIAKDVFDDFVDLSVKNSERDLRGAGFFAQPAVRAPSCHVDGPDQMKQRNLGREVSRAYEIRVFKTAFSAETDRANVPASIALDALLKLIHPPGKTFPGFEAIQVFGIGTEGDAQGLLDFSCLPFRNRSRDCNLENLDPPLFNLIPCLKNFQCPLVALCHWKADSGFRIQTHQLPRYFLKRITKGLDAQVIHLFDRIPGKDMRQRVSIRDPVCEESIHHALFKPIPNLFDDLVIHGSVPFLLPLPFVPSHQGRGDLRGE
jgi:hypothetical protein